jgi:hypothetical protein
LQDLRPPEVLLGCRIGPEKKQMKVRVSDLHIKTILESMFYLKDENVQ